MVDLCFIIRSLTHKNNWEDTKLLVSSVPRSSMISRSQSYTRSLSLPVLSPEKVFRASISNRSNAEKYKTLWELSRRSWAIQWEEKSSQRLCCHRSAGCGDPGQRMKRNPLAVWYARCAASSADNPVDASIVAE